MKAITHRTYECDIWLDFPDKNGHMMIGQLFSINALEIRPTSDLIQAQADYYYKKHAGAESVTISSYTLIAASQIK